MNVPQLPVGAFVDKDGMLTSEALLFIQNLVSGLTDAIGQQGFQVSQVTDADSATIESNQNDQLQYTCQLGTIIYNIGTNKLEVALDSGGGVPAFTPLLT